MTVPTGTVQTYAAIGRREDLTDMIWDISPTDTPFTSGIGRGARATQTKHEWQTDALAAAAVDNAGIEGDDAPDPVFAATARLANYTQIFRKTVIVSRTQRRVNTAGRADELAYQLTKKSRELRRDIEAGLTQNVAGAVGDASTARTAGSLEAWIATNTDINSGDGGKDGGWDGTKAVAATDATKTRAFTEAILKTLILGAYNSGGNPTVLMVGPAQKQVVSAFDGNATRFVPMEREQLYAAFDVYHSDFGAINVVPNRFSRNRTALLLDMELWAIAFLDPIQQEVLAKTGDADKRFLVGELTLESRNEAGSAAARDLT